MRPLPHPVQPAGAEAPPPDTPAATAPGRAPGSTFASRRGFTLVELLIVVVIMGLLAGLAAPNLKRAILKARAAEALSDLDVIRVAVLQYQAENHQWPPDRNRGQIPPGLEEFLPDGFSFTAEEYQMDYDNWASARGFIGLTVITRDREFGEAMLDMLGNNTWTNRSYKFTYVIEWTD